MLRSSPRAPDDWSRGLGRLLGDREALTAALADQRRLPRIPPGMPIGGEGGGVARAVNRISISRCWRSALAVLIYVEWHTDEVTVVLALLLPLSAALGFVRPAAALATGLVLGLAILVAHAGSFLTGLYSPAYQGFPPSRHRLAGDGLSGPAGAGRRLCRRLGAAG